MIDLTITIGNIIEIGTLLGGGVVVFNSTKYRVDRMNEIVGELRDDVKALKTSFAEFAVLDNRVKHVEDDIRELRHGRGFVREAIEGEYPRPSR